MQAIVLAIQQLYPRIYHACHREHRRGRRAQQRLSEHHAAILAHLDAEHGVTAAELRRHLGVGAPAMSSSIAQLERLELVQRAPRRGASPARGITLTPRGVEAVGATSVLDGDLLHELVARLSPRQRTTVVTGLRLLAEAATSRPAVESRP